MSTFNLPLAFAGSGDESDHAALDPWASTACLSILASETDSMLQRNRGPSLSAAERGIGGAADLVSIAIERTHLGCRSNLCRSSSAAGAAGLMHTEPVSTRVVIHDELECVVRQYTSIDFERRGEGKSAQTRGSTRAASAGRARKQLTFGGLISERRRHELNLSWLESSGE